MSAKRSIKKITVMGNDSVFFAAALGLLAEKGAVVEIEAEETCEKVEICAPIQPRDLDDLSRRINRRTLAAGRRRAFKLADLKAAEKRRGKKR